MNKLKELQERLKATLTPARDIAAKAEAEGRDFTDDERDQVAAILKAAAPIKEEIAKAKDNAAVADALKEFGDDIGFEPGTKSGQADASGLITPTKSLGAHFVESDAFKAMVAAAPNGRFGEKMRVQSAPVGFKTLVTGLSDTSAGALVTPDRTNIIDLLGRAPLTVRNLVSARTTGSDTVEFVRQTSRVNAAAPVAEATATAGTSGVKPEGGFALEVVTENVRTLAEWIPATKRSLSDASQIRGLIDDELRGNLAELEDDQMLNGDGTGENLTGILETVGIQTQAYSATVTDLDPLLETTFKAKTKVKTVGRATANAYMLNPADWETIHLNRLAKNPANEAVAGSVPTLHGLPVIESEAIAAGTGLVGDWRRAVVWDREQASITVSDSHADFFIRNMVAVLGEQRLAFGVIRPAAFVSIDLTEL
ncbi:phage major capsid protein [Glycomyces paridis]|uniref:Phage major capsid protein n=1 Tax=Glycomyces paridis TaxID=2126555 RepID=A0A4S8PE88_9ACTN|nr:phage major capsid protein [Glycomyces paridis]THV27935.1 phage major capsid protein [Glycomyces paridis]